MLSTFMHFRGHVGLLSLALFLAPSAASGAGLEDAKVALHLQAHTTKSLCSIGTAPSIPCYQYQTAGDVGVCYDLYLVVGNVGPFSQYPPEGLTALSCGIEYNGAPGQGLDVYSWTYCGDGLEFPKEGPQGPWPNAGAGIRLTWVSCYTQDIPPSGGHKIAGSFYVYAYSADHFNVTENRNLESGPEFRVVKCSGSELDLPLEAAGMAAFSSGMTDPGFNPCPQDFPPICDVPLRNLTFGQVGVGGYKDITVYFSNDGAPENGAVEGTVTETCPEVTIVSGETYSLPNPGDATSVVLRFTPTSYSPLSCNVNLGPACSWVQLTGTGIISPHPEVDPSAIVRGIWPETSRWQTFEVSNLGGANLVWDTKLEFGTLEDVLASLDANSATIVGSIPNRYDFPEGVTGNSLGFPFLGGSRGNHLTTDIGVALGENLDYSDGVIRSSNVLGPGGRYFTRKYPGLFVFVGEFMGVEQFKVLGRFNTSYSNKDHFWLEALEELVDGLCPCRHGNIGIACPHVEEVINPGGLLQLIHAGFVGEDLTVIGKGPVR